jgi:serine/threonine protein kinase
MRLASGDLLQHVNERSPLAEIESRHIFQQLVAAMDYVHQTGVIHRDLKLENILLTYRGGDLSVPVVLVADWGFATRYEPGQRMQTEKVGSLSYCAPELLSGLLYIGPEVSITVLEITEATTY